MHADQAKTGFLGRNDFYNALKLVTVAQSKRDLTPDIVKAALFGPAASKIPAPQINLAAIPPQRPNPVASSSVGQIGVTSGPTSSQGYAYRGQGLAGSVGNQQYLPSQQGANMRPPQSPGVSSFCGRSPASSWSRFRCLLTLFGSQFITGISGLEQDPNSNLYELANFR